MAQIMRSSAAAPGAAKCHGLLGQTVYDATRLALRDRCRALLGQGRTNHDGVCLSSTILRRNVTPPMRGIKFVNRRLDWTPAGGNITEKTVTNIRVATKDDRRESAPEMP
jgi:hypothetical protein